ncbi:MAG TPA: 1-deoxy-D-xylulose-5-phosphate reductoisomerase [Candidatus Brocadiia bacterium]|nr:1-deoxy-D-xylulose-5-phosphate reductoisomerase [Candidatus Brocadiia bacterium]
MSVNCRNCNADRKITAPRKALAALRRDAGIPPTRKISILGSTGSIGKNTLDVIRRSNGNYRVRSLAANTSWQDLRSQIEEFRPGKVALADEAAARNLRRELGNGVPEVISGTDALAELAADEEVDTVVIGVVGAAGLLPTIEAIRTGKKIALANKETFVMAGRLIEDAVAVHDAVIIPIDSEHNALFQLLASASLDDVVQVTLTASGGSLYNMPLDGLHSVTPAEALAHPNWKMGRKITIDSATMMNKAFEVIEAHWLFGLKPEQIEVLVHRQSIVHGIVEMKDGSMMAHMGMPDMRLPISHALTYPARNASGIPRLDLTRVGSLTFEKPDPHRFPGIALGFEAIRRGGTTGVILNAANECAVDAFLGGVIPFTAIVDTAVEVLSRHAHNSQPTLDEILEADVWAREETTRCLKKY